jgi:hypothetical protein
MRRRGFRVAITALGCAAFLTAGGVGSALGDASGQASCIGIEFSSVSPPGSSDEIPGGGAELVVATKAEAGGKFGPAARAFAKLHEGSHEACDEAAG